MADAPLPTQRRHVLERLARLVPDSMDVEAIDRFVQERAAIVRELEAIASPWTQQDCDTLDAAVQHARDVLAEMDVLHRRLAQEIRGLQQARPYREAYLAPRLTRRY